MRLGLVVIRDFFCCDTFVFSADFQPVLAKRSKHFDLTAALSVGVGQMQRNFKPIEQVQGWKAPQISDDFAKLWIYDAFVEESRPKRAKRKTVESIRIN